MKTKKLEKFQQEIASLSVEELQQKRKKIIKKRKNLFIWGINGTWIAGLLALLLVLVLEDIAYKNFVPMWLFLSLYMLCFLPFVPLIVRAMRTSDIWVINSRLRELGSESEVIN